MHQMRPACGPSACRWRRPGSFAPAAGSSTMVVAVPARPSSSATDHVGALLLHVTDAVGFAAIVAVRMPPAAIGDMTSARWRWHPTLLPFATAIGRLLPAHGNSSCSLTYPPPRCRCRQRRCRHCRQNSARAAVARPPPPRAVAAAVAAPAAVGCGAGAAATAAAPRRERRAQAGGRRPPPVRAAVPMAPPPPSLGGQQTLDETEAADIAGRRPLHGRPAAGPPPLGARYGTRHRPPGHGAAATAPPPPSTAASAGPQTRRSACARAHHQRPPTVRGARTALAIPRAPGPATAIVAASEPGPPPPAAGMQRQSERRDAAAPRRPARQPGVRRGRDAANCPCAMPVPTVTATVAGTSAAANTAIFRPSPPPPPE